jgi:hypothetical protein
MCKWERSEALADLRWLDEHGALAGVAEIIRERRRQIEDEGYTPAHDREKHADGYLVSRADAESTAAIVGVAEGIFGPEDVEHHMRRSGALAAAEIDRLNAEFTPGPAKVADCDG